MNIPLCFCLFSILIQMRKPVASEYESSSKLNIIYKLAKTTKIDRASSVIYLPSFSTKSISSLADHRTVYTPDNKYIGN